MTEKTPDMRACGFTLLEVVVAMLLMLIVTGTIFSTYRFQLFGLKNQDAQLEVQQAARAAMDLIVREVRLAGYDPTCAKTFAAVADARPQLLKIQFDRNADGAIGVGESITYSYSADFQEIDRNAGQTNVPLVSGFPSDALAFTYYDANGALLAPSGSPLALTTAQRSAVRRVHVGLHFQTSSEDPLHSSAAVSDLVSNIDLRNRFLNNAVGCS